MRGAQLFEMVEKRGQPFYLIELKLYLISKSRAKALDLREERGARISQRRGPLGRRILIFVLLLLLLLVALEDCTCAVPAAGRASARVRARVKR